MLSIVLPITALAVTLAYWPLWEGGGITPRWIALAVLTALGLLATNVRITTAHSIGLAFLAYCCLSCAWTPVFLNGAGDLAFLLIFAGVFMLGAECDDMKPTIVALGLGVSLNAFVAMTQAMGQTWVAELASPAGLFVNRNYLSEIAAVTLVLCVGYRLWWLAPGPLLAVLLTHSRGSLLALGIVGVVWCCRRSRAAAGAVAGLCVALGIVQLTWTLGPREFRDDSSLVHRIGVWAPTLEHLTPLGYGIGSFYTEYPLFQPHPPLAVTRPAHAHNEVIHVASELGIPGLTLFLAFFGWCLASPLETERLALACVLAIGLFSFPLHLPATAFVAALVAGRCARACADLRAPVRAGGAGSAVGLRGA